MVTLNNKLRRGWLTVAAIAAGFCVISGINAEPPAAQPSPPAMLPPLATTPVPATQPTVVSVPYRPWMPPARADREPRMLSADKRHALRTRPPVDLPPVADSLGGLPAEMTMVVDPLIRLASPNPAIPPVATIAAHPDSGKPTVQTDPTENLAPPGALIASPPPRTAPAPLLLVTIPDPSKQPGEIPTPAPQQEDAPASSFDLPAAPRVTVGK